MLTEQAFMFRYSRVLRLIVFATAPSAITAQQPGSAGAERPHLQVLQSLPETQLFPLMNLMARSLGVHCDYCHVQANPDLSGVQRTWAAGYGIVMTRQRSVERAT